MGRFNGWRKMTQAEKKEPKKGVVTGTKALSTEEIVGVVAKQALATITYALPKSLREQWGEGDLRHTEGQNGDIIIDVVLRRSKDNVLLAEQVILTRSNMNNVGERTAARDVGGTLGRRLVALLRSAPPAGAGEKQEFRQEIIAEPKPQPKPKPKKKKVCLICGEEDDTYPEWPTCPHGD